MELQIQVRDLIYNIYNRFLRPRLPYKISVHNGVPVNNQARLLDFTDQFPEYEAALVSAIWNQVKEQDTVVVVGGGLGVSTVTAVNATAQSGSVVTYEGSKRQYNTVKQTVQINQVSDCVELNHAIVGSFLGYSSDTYGEEENADKIDPATLPECDVLVLDCEGAELEILEQMNQLPRAIVVETHAFLDSPEDKVRKTLSERGYSIINRGIELESQGVFVLTARKHV